MFRRRFTKKGWLQLSALAAAALALLFLIVAPLATLTVRIDLPAVSASSKPMPTSELLAAIGGLTIAFLVICLWVGAIVALTWLAPKMARKIIEAQPKSDA